MESINWIEILEQEDRIIANSDRKQRYHFSSLDAMSEEARLSGKHDQIPGTGILCWKR